MTDNDFDVRVLRLQPGDVVALKANRPITGNEADRIRDRWESRFPDLPVVVLDESLDLSIVRREEADNEADDIHNLPLTWDHQRQHELTRTCWCGPGTKPRIGGPGRIVVHVGENEATP